MDYLLEALKRRELFSWLHLTPLTFWHALLLRDRFNFLGLVAPVPDSLKQQLSQQPGALTQVRIGGQGLGFSFRSNRQCSALVTVYMLMQSPISTWQVMVDLDSVALVH